MLVSKMIYSCLFILMNIQSGDRISKQIYMMLGNLYSAGLSRIKIGITLFLFNFTLKRIL